MSTDLRERPSSPSGDQWSETRPLYELEDYPRTRSTTTSTTTQRAVEPRRRSTWTARFGGLVLMVLALVGSLALLGNVVKLPDLNPFPHLFGSTTTDRTQPPVLESVRDLSEYTAASGTFQVIVDLEHGTKNVPDFIKGDRTLFLATGNVDASVDFGALDASSVTVAKNGAVDITLPKPTLGKAHLDLDQSHVYSEQRGLFDRIGDAMGKGSGTDRDKLYAMAQDKITKSAKATDLTDRAETNTRQMLTKLLGSLGHRDVTVTFASR